MEGFYSKPLRIYLIMGALAAWGLFSGTKLPVSLFPMSSQPTISVSLSYGSLSSQQFFESVGRDLEAKLQTAKADGMSVDKITTDYNDQNVRYRVKFGWGTNPDEAQKAVETIAMAFVSTRELSIRRSLSVRYWSDNQGFLAISFYSPLRSLDSLYESLLPLTKPMQANVPDANGVDLYNPNKKEISVKLSPEKLALHQLSTMQIENSLRESVISLNGGTIHLGEKEIQLTIPKAANSIDYLKYIRVSPLNTAPVLLKDVAEISVIVSKESSRKFKTSGVESLILFAEPKEGGNIKRMADDVMAELKKIEKQLPKDVEYKILVNPSDFINQSIMGVIKEVGVAAFLAVAVLFLFIGSLKNVATAAIEIPLSLIMAFILMRLTGMNLNLISLGGLALSAGMNVDASVVVLENIFRHLEGKAKNISYAEKIKIVMGAVNEVKLPIIASTIASLVVFTPLIFTKGLTNALLGDLAKAVVFSHGLSAIVALILVPTIRLHLMKSGDVTHPVSPIEGVLKRIESFYRRTLTYFLKSKSAQIAMVLAVVISLPLLVMFVVPKLKKEVMGRPETDWLIVGIYSPVMSAAKEMESEIARLEESLFKNFDKKIKYTFTQINGANNGYVMMRLDSRKEVEALSAKAEELYKNTPTLFYFVERWNPSELEIPDPPLLELNVVGGSPEKRLLVAEDILSKFSDQGVYDNVESRPSTSRNQFISIEPLGHFTAELEVMGRAELSHYLRTASDGIYVDDVSEGAKALPIYMRFPDSRTSSILQLQALPIGFDGRLIPLGALAQFTLKPKAPEIYRVNQTSLVRISGKLKKINESMAKDHRIKAEAIIEQQREKLRLDKSTSAADLPSLNIAIADIELQQALDQLKTAVIISALLVFLVMIIQLGDVIQASLVMVSIPLGMIGVIISLFIFKSSLSLNSGLGTILLNGIAVANSIILVDFIQKLFVQGRSALNATVDASTTRLRPILMTSLTTVLGMLPIALGLGEGGQILQPLGVAVCGGLWISALMTLYIVPALQYQYLKFKEKQQTQNFSDEVNQTQFLEERMNSRSPGMDL
ncbi:MAG: efflux RND transporter permease subunit [Bdellovibrionaceae bacterium]|nr:efflux RND transporter permease subunit [Bdellovibrio sp.]